MNNVNTVMGFISFRPMDYTGHITINSKYYYLLVNNIIYEHTTTWL